MYFLKILGGVISLAFKSSRIRTINRRSRLTDTFHVYICSLWDVKEPTHYSKRAGHEVPGVVAVLCESLGMGGYREGDMPRMGLSIPFAYHPCTSVQKLKKTKTKTKQKTQLNHMAVSLPDFASFDVHADGSAGPR